MTVAPPSPTPISSSQASAATPPGAGVMEPGWLAGDLQLRVQKAAAASGMTLAAVCELWVREGLDRYEAHQGSEDPDGSGRCSLRTGTCSLGPVPLPVQQ